jgi:hypothetical protein
MSRLAERAARIEATLEKLDEVMTVMLDPGGSPPVLVGAIGGSVSAQENAIRDWYARHPKSPVRDEHQRIVRPGGSRSGGARSGAVKRKKKTAKKR